MKSRATLSLIEQAIMVLVFSVAAAICLRVFVYADSLSKENAALDMACIHCQNAAETLKHFQGDMDKAAAELGGSVEGGVWTIKLDADWAETDGAAVYTLTAERAAPDSKYIGAATVSVRAEEELFSLELRWQEGG